MNTIDQLWGRIEANLSLGVSSPSVQLTSGASPQAIEQLETVIGVVLPENFRASCHRHDGGFAMQLIAPIEIVVEILSVQQIAETWRIHADLLLDDTGQDSLPTISARSLFAPDGIRVPSSLFGGLASGFRLVLIAPEISPVWI